MTAFYSTALLRSAFIGSGSRLMYSNPCLSALARKALLPVASGPRIIYGSTNYCNNLLPQMSQAQSLYVSSKSMVAVGAQNEHDHTKLWTAERFLSVALLGVLPAAFVFPSPAMDYLTALTLTIHSHWGIEAIVVDYVRPKIFGPVLPKVALAAVYALSAFTLGGLFYFNYSDVGLVNAIKMLWKL